MADGSGTQGGSHGRRNLAFAFFILMMFIRPQGLLARRS